LRPRLRTTSFIALIGLAAALISCASRSQGPALPDPIAKIDRQSVSRADYLLQWALRWGEAGKPQPVDVAAYERLRAQALELLLERKRQAGEARRRGIEPPPQEVDGVVAQTTREIMTALRESARQIIPPLSLREAITNWRAQVGVSGENMDEEQFERWLEEWLTKDGQAEYARDQVLVKMLQAQVEAGIKKPTEEDLRNDYHEYRVAYVTFLWRPEDRPDLNGFAGKQAAWRAAEQAAQRARKEDFTALSKSLKDAYGDKKIMTGESPYMTAFSLRNELGAPLGRQIVQAKSGQVIGPARSRMGFTYLIQRLDQRLNAPADLETNKPQLLQRLESREKWEAWTNLQRELKDKVKVEMLDPELRGAQLSEQGEKRRAAADFERALRTYGRGLSPDVYSGVLYALGDCYVAIKRYDEARERGYLPALSPPGAKDWKPTARWTADLYIQLGASYYRQIKDEKTPESLRPKLLEGMRDNFNKALQINPNLEGVHTRICYYYDDVGKPEWSLPEHIYLAKLYDDRKGEEDDLKAGDHHYWLFKYYRKIGNAEQAKVEQAWLEEFIKKHPELGKPPELQ